MLPHQRCSCCVWIWWDHMSDAGIEIRLLKDLEPQAALELLEQAERRMVCADDIIFVAGEPARSVHVLASGAAKLVQTMPNGAKVIIKYVRPGEIFGSPALLEKFYPVDA